MQPTNHLDVVREIVRADESFFRNAIRMAGGNPVPLMVRYMEMRATMFDYLTSSLPMPEPSRVQMTFQIPANWGEPVPVVATPEQIRHAIVPLANGTPTSVCAICQDDITEGGCELRNCGHRYHHGCISNWFTASVRCPVCRNDIREAED